MKLKNRLLFGLVAIAAMLSSGACTDLLKETPRSIYTPDFFATPKGVENGVTSLYTHLRYLYGSYYYSFTESGTDEYTIGESAEGNNTVPDMFNPLDVVDYDNDRSGVVWGNTFPNINTANGIIFNGETANEEAGSEVISPSLIAEAYFFRAFDYFLLVQTFGGVPLDLGSGELQFNQTPTTSSVRNTVPEVYTRAIFPDLLKAVADLPATSRATGTVNKTTARLYLAKAYLTYAWWLENPNNIATYPETPRTDPDGKSASQYFQLAYDTALEAINNPGAHGLEEYYIDVNWAGNERNKEMLLYADHSSNIEYGGQSGDYGSPDAPFNGAVWFVTWQYDQVQDANGGMLTLRSATQWGGRPWTRMAPPIEVFTNTFADKTNDSRFDGTFSLTTFGNRFPENETRPVANGMQVGFNEPVVRFLAPEQITSPISYNPDMGSTGKGNFGLGEMAGESAWVIGLTDINRAIYPGLWKMGPARIPSEIGMVNYTSPRPYYIAKFSELYLVAAEAAVKGASGSMTARDLLNVLRARAGKWKHKNSDAIYEGTNGNYAADRSAEMVAATPANPDIFYVLAERSRELFGEGYRWYDLARTQTWHILAAQYTICDFNTTNGKTPRNEHRQKTFTRPISDHMHYYLRPIPQGQFDRMEMDIPTEQAYQNPGYSVPE